MDKDYRFIPFSDEELTLISNGLLIVNNRTRERHEYDKSDNRYDMGTKLVTMINCELEERKIRERKKAEADRKAREIHCECCNQITGYKNG